MAALEVASGVDVLEVELVEAELGVQPRLAAVLQVLSGVVASGVVP